MFKMMLRAELELEYAYKRIEKTDNKSTERAQRINKRYRLKAAELEPYDDGIWNCLEVMGIADEYLNWAVGKNDINAIDIGLYNTL